MPLDNTAIENALAAWLRSATGLPVVWDYQDGPRPSQADGTLLPHCCLNITSITSLTNVGEERLYQDLDRPNGEEIEIRFTGPVSIQISAKAYTRSVIGSSSAKALLNKASTALFRTSIRDAMVAAGLGIYDTGNVIDLTSLLATEYESRASLDIRAYALDDASDFVGYIDKVSGEGTYQPGNITETLDVDAS